MTSDVEDLVRWRLLQQRVLHQMDEVRKAVGWLVENGMLSLLASHGTAELYMLNRERSEEAERFATAGSLEHGSAVKKKRRSNE